MKNLKTKALILTMLLVSVFVFSQNLQPKPIKYDNTDGVFITIDLMDAVTVKLIDRNFLIKEVAFMEVSIENLKTQSLQQSQQIETYKSKSDNYFYLYNIAERQKAKALESYENQLIITKNVKKKHLETDSFILAGAFPSVLLRSPC